MVEEHSVDLLYLACNRLEFTQESFAALLTNTDWRYVHQLFVYDDGSIDGTREWLVQQISQVPAPSRFVKTNFKSPVAAMVHFIEMASAPMLAKTDNDAMLPPAWLRQSLEVFDHHPELMLLGIEAMYPHQDDLHLVRSYAPAQFISGLGLYRRVAFRQSRPRPYKKWFGLEEWQMAQETKLTRGWITPALPVFLLDRFPFGPWTTYSDTYIQRGWQCSWPKYDPACSLWHWRWPPDTPATPAVQTAQTVTEINVTATKASAAEGERSIALHIPELKRGAPAFKVVILSKRAANLVPCVQSVLTNEPELPPDHIIVVDDGARTEAEAQLPPIQWVTGIKPFIFARNANLGIRAANTDIILLNDDARLITPFGFTRLAQQVQSRSRIGLCSAGIRGIVANSRQLATGRNQLRVEPRMLAFICVYLPQAIYEQLGALDERFIGYGFEDNDYCTRALAAGWQLAVWDGCVVDHSGELPSTFRTQADIQGRFQQNRHLYRQKWGREV